MTHQTPADDGTVDPNFVSTTTRTYGVDTKAFWLDLLDRAVKTFLQNIALFLAAGTSAVSIASVAWGDAVLGAAFATLITVILAFAFSNELTSGNWVIDTLDRAGRTFAATVAGAIPAVMPAGGFAAIDWADVLGLAASAAVLSLITSVLTTRLGDVKTLPTTAPVQRQFALAA